MGASESVVVVGARCAKTTTSVPLWRVLLHLHRNFHATLVDDRSAYVGMLRKAQSCLTWREISKENIALLLRKRERLVGNQKLTDKYAKELGYKSLDELAEAKT